ncbi:hypothetical protein F5B19DRAFT_474945 [Rostrohypoxylon terebratum]|nr:hypothetical protein F5B19DRAFT_474945 [Rostrohypoxylon terebratum]
MGPLYLAAMSGNEEIVQELLEAKALMGTRTYMQGYFKSYLRDVCLLSVWPRIEEWLMVNPINLSIVHGHHHIAAILTNAFVEKLPNTRAYHLVMPLLRFAITHNAPLVIETLRFRVYRTIENSFARALLELSVEADGNEVILSLLAGELARDPAYFHDVFKIALRYRCEANLLFLAKYATQDHEPTFGPGIFSIYIEPLLRTDKFLPVVKELLGGGREIDPAVSINAKKYLLDNLREGLWMGRGVMIQRHLLHHPKLEFSKKGLKILLKDLERREKHREWIKTLPENEQEKLAKKEEDMFSKIQSLSRTEARDLVSLINLVLDGYVVSRELCTRRVLSEHL